MREHFLKLKSNLELDESFYESIKTRHNALREYVKNNNPKVKDTKLIGSLQRKTRFNPGTDRKFDVDILVIMGEFAAWSSDGVSPEHALDDLHSTVYESERYSQKNPTQNAPTITLTYEDKIQIELVPAYIDNIGSDPHGNYLGSIGRGYWVPKDGMWVMADYDHEAAYITYHNILSEGYLVPTIKMLKAIKRIHFPQLESFPLEIIAANIIPLSVVIKQNNSRQVHYHDLLFEFFDQAPVQLSDPIQVPDSKSAAIHLDQTTVTTLTEKFRQIAAYIASLNQMTSQGKKVEGWRALFGDHFPVTVNL